MGEQKRDEWMRLMIELAAVDREAYRAIRAEAWRAAQRNHATKSPEEIETWRRGSS